MSGDSNSLTPNWTSASPHVDLKSFKWLVGTWKSISAVGSYPTIDPFTYCEEITFSSFGQPLLNYNSIAWHSVKKCPMHLESGFLRIKPGTNTLAFMVAHNFGLTTVEEGTVTENTIKLSTLNKISRMSFARGPEVTGLKRCFELINNKLHQTIHMKTNDTDFTQHLKVIYEKV